MPVLAAYYADIAIVESASNLYEMFPAQVPLNVTLLVANGYITATGFDTLVHAGIHPHMLADDRLLFALEVLADSSNIVEFTTGNAPPLTEYYLIIGYGGSISVGDHAELELDDGFDIAIRGWVDTSVSGATYRLMYKQDAFRIYVVAADTIRVSILGGGDVESVGVSTPATVTSGLHTVRATADGVDLKIYIDGAEVGTVALGGNSVPDNGNAWAFMENDTLPYVEYITIEASDW